VPYGHLADSGAHASWLGHVPSRLGLHGAPALLLVGQRRTSTCYMVRLDARTDLARGTPWTVHLEVTDTWTEHDGPR
jgi:hypothetical protein